MSWKHIRKLTEQAEVLNLEDDSSDDTLQPQCKTNRYKELNDLMSSSNESETKDQSDEEQAGVVAPIKKKKKKKNKAKKSRSIKSSPVETVASTSNVTVEEKTQAKPDPKTVESQLFKVNSRYLDEDYEMTLVLGQNTDEKFKHKPRSSLCLFRRRLTFKEDRFFTGVKLKGLEMTLIRVEDGIKYYKYVHSPKYQEILHTLIFNVKLKHLRAWEDYGFDHSTNTAEGCLEGTDSYFELEDFSSGVSALQRAIHAMQNSFVLGFNLIDGKTRLEYKYVENRPFHIALLKYVYVLTHKGSHRSALEVAKLLLNLDPSDPFGVIFTMDILAMRSRQYKWFLDTYDLWSETRDASRLFHMRYSQALAKFHIATENKDSDALKVADTLLKEAMLHYPTVTVNIIKKNYSRLTYLLEHDLFSIMALNNSMDCLGLISLYVKLVWHLWAEPNVVAWFSQNAKEVVKEYDNSPEIQARVKKFFEERRLLFCMFPLQLRRQMKIITPLSKIIVDGEVPPVPRTLLFNPYPELGINVDEHEYYVNWTNVSDLELRLNSESPGGPLSAFFTSMLPVNY